MKKRDHLINQMTAMFEILNMMAINKLYFCSTFKKIFKNYLLINYYKSKINEFVDKNLVLNKFTSFLYYINLMFNLKYIFILN